MTNKRPSSAELHPGPGFQVRRQITRPTEAIVKRFAQLETPDISDLLNRLYAMDPGIKNLTDGKSICGPAVTVKVFPGDNLMVHKALDIAQPGDLVVVDAGGSTLNGILGDLIATKAKHRGIAGFVVDGLIRDLPGVIECGMTVYARGVTPIGPLHRGPGEINHSVSCGGIVVNAGDLICGDANGIVVVRQEHAEELLARVEAYKAATAPYVENVRKGIFSNQWVDAALESARCPIQD